MKTKLKKIIIVALTIFVVIALVTGVDATGADNSNKVKELFQGASNPEGTTTAKNILSAILGVVRTAGAAVAIIMLMTIAAKYIIASAGERADIKKYAVNYVIGAIILFGTTGILGIVQKFVTTSIK